MTSAPGPIRVVVVDDSPTVRGLLAAVLHEAGGFQVVGTGSTGHDAVRLVKSLRPDVLTMDIRMPGMSGLEATRLIMRDAPTPIVIVTGSLTQAEVDVTFEALRCGALTVLQTPSLADSEGCHRLIQSVRLMAGVPVVHHWHSPARDRDTAGLDLAAAVNRREAVALVGMAASTGGPAALAAILSRLPADFPVPILVVQHIASGFLAGLADWLAGQTKLRTAIAAHGDVPRPGMALLAPDGYHLQVNGCGAVELIKEPPYKGLRPSANYLFRSMARSYGPRAVGVILSGMGDDGAEGLQALRRAGGLTLAQDESSCVVFGMPREALACQAIDRVLPPEQIALALQHVALGRRGDSSHG